VTGITTNAHKTFLENLAATAQGGAAVAYGDSTAYFSPQSVEGAGALTLPLPNNRGLPDSQSDSHPIYNRRMGSAKHGKTFLVVEDSADDALLIRRAFAAVESCQAIVCRNLSEAKAYMMGAGLYQNRDRYPLPNAIICDLHIGFESGVDFVLWIKEHEDFKSMPVIILTGTATTSEAVAAKEKGALDVLRKPSRFEDLRTMLNDLAAKLCG
jgi:CheY-like chemotaxis protein